MTAEAVVTMATTMGMLVEAEEIIVTQDTRHLFINRTGQCRALAVLPTTIQT